MYYTQNSTSNSNPQHQLKPMQQKASSLAHSTPDSQPYNTLQAPLSTDLSSAYAMQELLQQVGLSSTNLVATPEQYENRALLHRPAPQPWDPTQQSEPKRNNRGLVNAPRQQNGRFQSLTSLTTEKTLTLPTTSEQDTCLKMKIRVSTYANSPAEFSSDPTYANLPNVIMSSSASNSSTSTYSDTLIPSTHLPSTPSFFVFPSSDQLASDLISFLVQVSPQSSSRLHLLVLENTLRKHFYPILVSHIESLYTTHPNRNYYTFDYIIRNSLSHFGIN